MIIITQFSHGNGWQHFDGVRKLTHSPRTSRHWQIFCNFAARTEYLNFCDFTFSLLFRSSASFVVCEFAIENLNRFVYLLHIEIRFSLFHCHQIVLQRSACVCVIVIEIAILWHFAKKKNLFATHTHCPRFRWIPVFLWKIYFLLFRWSCAQLNTCTSNHNFTETRDERKATKFIQN